MFSHFIYNPDGIGSHCHSASIALHKNEIVATWYGYAEKETEKGQIAFSRFNRDKSSWDKPVAIFPNLKNSSCGNPIIFSDPTNGVLHIYFVILKFHYWDSAQVYHSYSEDDGRSWSAPNRLMIDDGIMVRHRPEVYKGSTLIFPTYDESKYRSIFYKSDPPYDKWQYVSEIDGEFIQADIFKYRGDEWQAYLRPAGDSQKMVYRALSADDCKSWTGAIVTPLPCPLSGVAARHLGGTNILICHNDTKEFKRSPISLSLSQDNGLSYKKLMDLDIGDIELSYPSMLVDTNGDIHILYTFNRRMIKHVCLTQKEILNG